MVDNTKTSDKPDDTFYVFQRSTNKVLYEAPTFDAAESYRQEMLPPFCFGVLTKSSYERLNK